MNKVCSVTLYPVFIYILYCLFNCLLIWKIQLFVTGQHPRCSPGISKIIFFSWLAMLLIGKALAETVLFGLEEPWPPQLMRRIIPWQIILNEGFPKPPAFWKVTSLLLGVTPRSSASRRRNSRGKGRRRQNWVPCGRHVTHLLGALPCHKLTFWWAISILLFSLNTWGSKNS